jgi:hypothetical protein
MNRPTISYSIFSSSIEWKHNLPPIDHSYSQLSLVFTNC